MIIGISGKKSHGKDTVAKIIQFLTLSDRARGNIQFKEVLNNERFFTSFFPHEGFTFSWKKKMFAYKVKEIVCMLINCTMEQLEDQTFKEKPLGPEWDFFRLSLPHGMMGRQISGPWPSHEEAWKYGTIQLGYSPNSIEITKHQMTPRLMLQLIGTECGRKIIHPNVWVNALMSEYVPSLKHYASIRGADGMWYSRDNPPIQIHTDNYVRDEFPNWIITDVRFPNEIKTIKEKEGLIIRVNRPGLDDSSIHESEILLDDYPHFDAVFDNSGIDYLFSQVKVFLKNKNLI